MDEGPSALPPPPPGTKPYPATPPPGATPFAPTPPPPSSSRAAELWALLLSVPLLVLQIPLLLPTLIGVRIFEPYYMDENNGYGLLALPLALAFLANTLMLFLVALLGAVCQQCFGIAAGRARTPVRRAAVTGRALSLLVVLLVGLVLGVPGAVWVQWVYGIGQPVCLVGILVLAVIVLQDRAAALSEGHRPPPPGGRP